MIIVENYRGRLLRAIMNLVVKGSKCRIFQTDASDYKGLNPLKSKRFHETSGDARNACRSTESLKHEMASKLRCR